MLHRPSNSIQQSNPNQVDVKTGLIPPPHGRSTRSRRCEIPLMRSTPPEQSAQGAIVVAVVVGSR